MRIKSRWHRKDRPRSPGDLASVAAAVAWRAALRSLASMREQRFEIEPGPAYFAYLSEFLAFLVQVADRIAYARLGGEEREQFTTTLALRLAGILEENQSELLGPCPEGSYRSRFIALVNERADDYAHFACTETGPDFGFLRCLGNRVADLLGERDQPWAVDQIMALEAPQAAATLQKAMAGLLEAKPG